VLRDDGEISAGVRTERRGELRVAYVRVCRVLRGTLPGRRERTAQKRLRYGGHRNHADGVPGEESIVKLFGDGRGSIMAVSRET
jgi:hypothetical protein